MKESEAATDNTIKDKLRDNSDKALVTVVHCNDDIKNIDEEKANEKDPSKIGITAPPEVRIEQWDVYTEKVKIAESTSNLNNTIISEAESAYNNDNTGSVLAVIKNSSNSDIRITSEMRDRHDNGNTRNIPEDKIVESTSCTRTCRP